MRGGPQSLDSPFQPTTPSFQSFLQPSAKRRYQPHSNESKKSSFTIGRDWRRRCGDCRAEFTNRSFQAGQCRRQPKGCFR
jgi:hypothetical protein